MYTIQQKCSCGAVFAISSAWQLYSHILMESQLIINIPIMNQTKKVSLMYWNKWAYLSDTVVEHKHSSIYISMM